MSEVVMDIDTVVLRVSDILQQDEVAVVELRPQVANALCISIAAVTSLLDSSSY